MTPSQPKSGEMQESNSVLSVGRSSSEDLPPALFEGPFVVNPKASGDLAIGDYVFASRWGDCDPGDPWHVGHVSEIGPRHVVVGDVSGRWWPHAMRITQEQGRSICENFPHMERLSQDYVAIARVFGVETPGESAGAQPPNEKAVDAFAALLAAATCAANVLFLLQDEVKALGCNANNVPQQLRAAIALATKE